MNENKQIANVQNDITKIKMLVHSIKSWERVIKRDEESRYAACVNMDAKFYRLEEARKALFELVKDSPYIELDEDIHIRDIADFVIATLNMAEEIC